MKPNYREITSASEWTQLLEGSDEQPVLLLKHSTSCPISGAAFKEFSVYTRKPKRPIVCVLVKVIESRPVSNLIADNLGIKHESPQILLIRGGEALWNASHWDVTYERIEQQVNERIAKE
ncbi:bacillithiol system redox-active protein YtxJ [Saccharibacillus sp. CPCC 101409]|uniref:bacillithiol system redox-active protein YtxJ n=1 Tax=Saccharibacillus sp. CPCC 101409 TaxID=3058041 RepID=UPI002673CA5D|nr:bacillithiol system redox-active protein YtxJ [Saccharibacillus sp. CPCC 101409]MDO3411214.1 bacillithiol system redox-active protein YtxJ [Saccharibacillus sp. CPCC 101409]